MAAYEYSVLDKAEDISGRSIRDLMAKDQGFFDGLFKSVGVRQGLDGLDDIVKGKVKVKGDGSVRFGNEVMQSQHADIVSALKKLDDGKTLTTAEASNLQRKMGRQKVGLEKLNKDIERLEESLNKVKGRPDAELEKLETKIEKIFDIAENAADKDWSTIKAEITAIESDAKQLKKLGFEIKGDDLIFKSHGSIDKTIAKSGAKATDPAVFLEKEFGEAKDKFGKWKDAAENRNSAFVEKLEESLSDMKGAVKESESLMTRLKDKGIAPIIEKGEQALAKAEGKELSAAEHATETAGKSKLMPGLLTAGGVALTLHGLSDEENKFNLRTIGGVVLTAVGLGGLLKGPKAAALAERMPGALAHSAHL